MKCTSAGTRRRPPAPWCLIPDDARKLSVASLSLSSRLHAALGSCGVKCLGDLRGRSEAEVREACGDQRTFEELKRFLSWTAVGSARLAAAGAPDSTGASILDHLDQLITSLSRREVAVLSLRYGGAHRMLTLRKLQTESGVSPPAASEMILRAIVRIRRVGGPELQSQIERVVDACLKAGCPLTQEIVRGWMGQRRRRFHYRPAFYVCLITELSHGRVPVWPVGQCPRDHVGAVTGPPAREAASICSIPASVRPTGGSAPAPQP
jgi:hypothetical protein